MHFASQRTTTVHIAISHTKYLLSSLLTFFCFIFVCICVQYGCNVMNVIIKYMCTYIYIKRKTKVDAHGTTSRIKKK